MSFLRHLLGSLLLSGTVFAAATLPLATFGNKPVAIQSEGQPVFTGPFKDLAGPYLGLSLVLSVGAGVTNLAVLRWHRASQTLGQTEAQLLALKQQLSDKDALIENLRFSPTRLQAAGLERFLQEDSQPARTAEPQVVLEPSA